MQEITIDELQAALELDLSKALSAIMHEETVQAFRGKGWAGRPWAPRKAPDIGSLMWREGHLVDSLVFRPGRGEVTVESPLPYALIHNEGGRIAITPKMRQYFFARYYASKKKQPHWLALAITKRTHIDIPKRQYVGITPQTDARLQEQLDAICSSIDLVGMVKLQIKSK